MCRTMLGIAGWVLLAACDGGGETPADGDSGEADAVDDTGETGADADADAEADAEAEADVGPRVITASDPELLTLDGWVVTTVDPGSDPVAAAIEDGTFDCPPEGSAYGATWLARPIRDNGFIGSFGPTLVYAATCPEVPAGVQVVAHGERAYHIISNGAPQPGDGYGSRRTLVPLSTHAGRNVVVVRAYGGRGALEAELLTVPDEVTFHTRDLTAPNPVPGDEDQDLYLGVPILNNTDEPLEGLRAMVLDNAWFEATVLTPAPLPPRAVTQVAFLLRPLTVPAVADTEMTVRLRVESPSLYNDYERDVAVTTVAEGAAFRRTFLSPDDGSVQYYGVRAPTGGTPTADVALVLSLHGAGVEAIGQAGAYAAKDWTYVVAATNRRPFGFDWEEWGRLNALFALDDAMARFPIDPTRVYLSGHSMGGHGTWHVGVTAPGRFATIGPSAGWESFYSYGGASRPGGPVGRARAHSDTLVYLSNLARRGVYIIHGDADDNVPVSEGRNMRDAVQLVSSDVVYHEEPGAGHWWDDPGTPGADCVDWPPLFEFMQARTLDPFELEFEFRTPSPAYSAGHSYVTLQSALTPMEDLVVASEPSGTQVLITTTNVRSMDLDGDALVDAGIAEAVVDGATHAVVAGPIRIGPADGKEREVGGPFNQVFHRPFCFVYPDDRPAYRHYAAYMTSYWQIYGNGRACALPYSELTVELRAENNVIYLGMTAAEMGSPGVPFTWDGTSIDFGGTRRWSAALQFVFPEGERLAAGMVTTEGEEWDLYDVMPFSSRGGMPDYLLWTAGRSLASGFFDAEWAYDPALGSP